jgi:hypothetical protein
MPLRSKGSTYGNPKTRKTKGRVQIQNSRCETKAVSSLTNSLRGSLPITASKHKGKLEPPSKLMITGLLSCFRHYIMIPNKLMRISWEPVLQKGR